MLEAATAGYKGLLGITGAYKGLKGVQAVRVA